MRMSIRGRLARVTPMAWLPMSLAAALGFSMTSGAEPRHPPPVQAAVAPPGWLVVAPHPDDEVLIAGGVIARAVAAHQPISVVFVTNGDLTCARDGLARERESIAALGELGLDESHVYFLGYPDGHVGQLGRAPLPPVERLVEGRCQRGNTTYGASGFVHRDFHSSHFGEPALYTAANLVADLSALLAELRPENVIVTHPQDDHPDHAATYAFVRRAIDTLPRAPRLHRAFVHTGDCWPIADKQGACPPVVIAPDDPMPPLFGALSGYVSSERLPVPEELASADVARNPKLRSLRAFVSQTGGSKGSHLFAFARSDEVFFPEDLMRGTGQRWIRRGSAPLVRGRVGSATVSISPGQEQRVAQRAPLGFRFAVPASRGYGAMDDRSPAQPEVPTVGRGAEPFALRFLADEGGGYALSINRAEPEALLWHQDGTTPPRLIHRWPLPADMWRVERTEAFEVRVDPRPEDGDVVELSLFARGTLVGIAVDARPIRYGEAISYAAPADAPPIEVELIVSP